MTFRKLYFFILLKIIQPYTITFAQNLISNPGFESLVSTNCPVECEFWFGQCDHYTTKFCRNDPDNCGVPLNPFYSNVVKEWKSAVGTAQLNMSGCLNSDTHSGSVAAFIAGQTNHVEGIYQDVLLEPWNNYNLSFYCKSEGAVTIHIYLTNGLTNTMVTNSNFSGVGQLIYSQIVNSSTWQPINLPGINPNASYSQFLIYCTATSGGVLIDDLSLTLSCCRSYMYYQNTSPPSTYVIHEIVAGRELDPNKPLGDVIIDNNNDINFQAGESITLLNGFTVQDANFIATVDDCANTPLKTEAAYWYEGKCDLVMEIYACFGSGDYTYHWDNDESSGKFRKVHPAAATTYSYSVHDNITGKEVYGSISVPAFPGFYGPISTTIPNVFSPNNDGINDYWRVTDNGKQEYAYNAFSFELEIFDPEFGKCYHQSGQTGHNGFDDNAIYWDASGRSTNTQYAYVLTLKNCDNEQATADYLAIQNFAGGNTFKIKADSLNDDINRNIFGISEVGVMFDKSKPLFYPNPASKNLYLNFPFEESEFKLIDQFGILYEIGTKSVIDISNFPNGIYVVEIKGMYSKEFIRSKLFIMH